MNKGTARHQDWNIRMTRIPFQMKIYYDDVTAYHCSPCSQINRMATLSQNKYKPSAEHSPALDKTEKRQRGSETLSSRKHMVANTPNHVNSVKLLRSVTAARHWRSGCTANLNTLQTTKNKKPTSQKLNAKQFFTTFHIQ